MIQSLLLAMVVLLGLAVGPGSAQTKGPLVLHPSDLERPPIAETNRSNQSPVCSDTQRCRRDIDRQIGNLSAEGRSGPRQVTKPYPSLFSWDATGD
jgi:hypothetical protein